MDDMHTALAERIHNLIDYTLYEGEKVSEIALTWSYAGELYLYRYMVANDLLDDPDIDLVSTIADRHEAMLVHMEQA